ncbi:29447_t:CDS:2 [Gigaspora margarita]|uniref:29447_t:CDS:1 n=1 Tax=Gigaspora margarita TaxID=4874 RepID=A0ABN7ULN6_GIGMA|nr:29447_t:CDS:2 [Gigaspora margarita]
MNEENLQKRNADLMEESESSSETEEYATNSSNQQSSTKKKSRPFAEIWDYYLKSTEISHGHYEASCYYCVSKKSWARGKLAILEAYLANECSNSLPNQIAITTHFLSNCSLSKAAVNRLDQKIAKAWIMAEIPFEVIENLFIKDMFKEFLPAYDLPSRTTLSANEISNIIEKLGSDKFSAIVTDAASNSHAVNLIAADLVKLDELKKLIANCGKINYFFNSSHSSHSLLIKGFTDMKIKVKTRWGSLYFTTDSMLRARPVFDWLLSEHLETITNQEIANLLANEDFYITCRLVRSIWQPIKEVIYALETNTATLADCFAYLIKLAVAIKCLPEINTFKASAVHCLKDNGFYQAALTSIEIWQNLGHTKLESNELIAQIQPQHLAELACRIFSINPTQASCERNFSSLKWILGDCQINLNISRLEGISKIRSYYTTNIRRELSFPDKELTETDLQDVCNLSSVGNIMCYEENQMDDDDEPLLDISNYSTTLLINEVIDLEIKNSEPLMEETSRAILSEDLDYNPCNVLNRFLEREKQSK